jgi:molybdenum cofactor cytidylyltransferase
MHDKFSVIMLAAGLSERMGTPKFLLNYSDNETFIEKLIDNYLELNCKEIVLVINSFDIQKFLSLNPELPENLKIVVNENPEIGRFYSIQLGVKELVNADKIFIHNVDNPYLNNELCLSLLTSIDGYDFVYPQFEGKGGHPILITETIVKDILSTVISDINFKLFLNRYKKKILHVIDPKVVTNINTPDDYNDFKKRISLK